jgi:hypothetical protein
MNSETQRLFKKLGFPMMTKDETEDLDQSLMSLQDPSSFDGSTMADAPVSGPGGTDLTNVYYVNFNPNTQTQSPQMRDQLKSVQADVTLNAQFLSIKSNDALNTKVSSREIDSNNETAKANYKAKVTNYLAQNAPWTAGFATKTLNKNFTVEKNKFHDTLVTTFTEGLMLPNTITTQLEGILTNISNTIAVSSQADEKLMFFILITLYQKDDVRQKWQPYLRTIYFQVDQSLSTYARSKGDSSSGVNVDVKIQYVQQDGQFNDSLFRSNAKESIQQLVQGKTGTFIMDPTNIPV